TSMTRASMAAGQPCSSRRSPARQQRPSTGTSHLKWHATPTTPPPASTAAPVRFDVPRNSQNVALVADPRNDENLMVSQLQLAFLRFHNAVVADVKTNLGAAYTLEEIFAAQQRTVRWA